MLTQGDCRVRDPCFASKAPFDAFSADGRDFAGDFAMCPTAQQLQKISGTSERSLESLAKRNSSDQPHPLGPPSNTGGNEMKRTTLSMLFVVGTFVVAHADSDVYDNIAKFPQGDTALQAATVACNYRWGMTPDHYPPLPEYKRCMLRHGWRYSHTEVNDNFRTWHRDHCAHVLFGSACS